MSISSFFAPSLLHLFSERRVMWCQHVSLVYSICRPFRPLYLHNIVYAWVRSCTSVCWILWIRSRVPIIVDVITWVGRYRTTLAWKQRKPETSILQHPFGPFLWLLKKPITSHRGHRQLSHQLWDKEDSGPFSLFIHLAPALLEHYLTLFTHESCQVGFPIQSKLWVACSPCALHYS